MQRRWTHWTLALILAAFGVCWIGCRKPAGSSAPPAASPATTTAPAGLEVDDQLPKIHLSIECPEQVDVGKNFLTEVVVENNEREPLHNLTVKASLDPGLKHEESAGPIEQQLTPIKAGESNRLGIVLQATRPGNFSYRAEVSQGEKILASDWTTITAEGEGGPMTPDEPAATPTEPKEPAAPDLGPPLVDDPDSLQQLSPSYPVWFDKANKSVVMVGAVCQRRAPLELFACLTGSKEHESVVAVRTKAYVVHAGLMAAGAEPGSPVQFVPEYSPPSGPEIEVQVIWKDEDGEKHTARAQDWIRNVESGKAMSSPWVFTGSRFYENEETGQRFYAADVEGDLICVANFPSAMLDVPVQSSDSDASLMFDAFTEHIPARGTPVTLVLTPKLDTKPQPAGEPAEPEPSPPAEDAKKPQDTVKPAETEKPSEPAGNS